MDRRGPGFTGSTDGKGHESSQFLFQRLMLPPVSRVDAQGQGLREREDGGSLL